MDTLALTSKIKVKLVVILVLVCLILGLLSTLNVSISSLLQGVDLDNVKVETAINGDVKILDNSENIRAKTSTSDISNTILELENPELTETDSQLLVSGEVDSNLIDNALNGKVGVTHIFNKETKEYLRSQIELEDKMNDKISEVVVNELSTTNSSLDEGMVDVSSNSVITVSPAEQTTTVTLEEELKSKLDYLQPVSISDKVKEITVNNNKYVLGTTKFTEDAKAQENVKFIVDDGIIYGVRGKSGDVKYLAEEDLKKELGEPTVIHDTKYWKVAVDNEEINIALTKDSIDVLYKHN